MTAPLRNTPHSSALAASQNQNTAPVAEFRCLYTNDLKRKQKRWQDGYLKFHTFNSRVMVYDQSRSFLGDTYWKESGALQEGDELTLDRGVMVEVAEAMGVTQTDLNPLFEKKKDLPPPSTAPAPPRRFQPPSQVAPSNVMRAASQMRHKSLNTLLGTPKGPIGKALPIVSPYEARKEQENETRKQQESKDRREQQSEWAVDREAKRQKTTHKPDTRRQPTPEKSLSSKAPAQRKPPRPIPRDATVIDIDCEPEVPDHVFSDITLPGTPPADDCSTPHLPITPAPAVQTPRPKIPRGKVPVPSVKALETPKQPPPPSSPPVSASNRLSNIEFAMSSEKSKPQGQSRREVVQKRAEESVRERAADPGREKTKESAQEQMREPGHERPRKSAQELTRKSAQERVREQSEDQTRRPPQERIKELPQNQAKPSLPPASPPRNPKARSLRLSTGVKRNKLMCQAPPPQWEPSEPRVSKTITKRTTILDESVPVSKTRDVSGRERTMNDSNSGTSKRKHESTAIVGEMSKKAKRARTPDVVPDEFDDADVLGMLDQQLLISPGPSVRETGVAKATHDEALTASPKPAATHPPSPQGKTLKNTTPQSPKASHRPPSPLRPDSRSRTSTPPRKPAFSTGGFTKKSKSKSKTSPTITSPTDPLPPDPAPRRGPMPTISTAELAALLTSSITSPKAAKSPRNFRRVRSENDAPVPSTAEEWEARNLPKANTGDTETEMMKGKNTVEQRGAAVATTTVAASASASASTSAAPPRKVIGSGLSELVKRTDPRRKMGRTQSLNVNVDPVGGGRDVEEEVQSPVVDADVGPWSTEAFDLFDWRRPDIV